VFSILSKVYVVLEYLTLNFRAQVIKVPLYMIYDYALFKQLSYPKISFSIVPTISYFYQVGQGAPDIGST